jgi:hypothetical protein
MSKVIKISALVIFVLIISIAFIVLGNKSQSESKKETSSNTQPQEDRLMITKTDPDPLENATILPIQSIIITFNKIIPKSEFKYQFDPEIKDHEIEAIGGKDPKEGSVIKINFKEPLKLGTGYTLKIDPNTRTNDNKKLDQEFNYHFKTIQYKGV